MRKSLGWYLLSILTSVAVFWRWFLPGVFAAGDFTYYFPSTFKEWIQSSAWVMPGLGGPSYTIWRYPLNFVFALLGKLDLSYELVFKLLVLWPIALGSGLVSFWFTKKLVKNNMAAYIGSLFLFSTTYFLSISTQGQLHLVVAAILGVLVLGTYIDAINGKSRLQLVASMLFLCATGFFDFRVAYIIVGLQSLYSVVSLLLSRKGEDKRFFPIFGFIQVIVLFGFINTFWILPTGMGGGASAGVVLNRGLFGSHFFNLLRSITNFFPYWNGVQPKWFQIQQIPFSFFLLPIVAFGALFVRSKNQVQKMYFLLVALVGVLLSKQAAEPFTAIYAWLYSHVPGFNAFREASKFYFLNGVAYASMITLFIDALRSSAAKGMRVLGLLISGALFLIFLSIGWVTVSGRIGSMFVPRSVPDSFSKLQSLYQDADFYRTAWLPNTVRWMFFTNLHPPISLVSLINTFLNQTGSKTQIDASSFTSVSAKLNKNYIDYLLDSASVRYVIVPENNQIDQNFQEYGEKQYADVRDRYLGLLDSSQYLQKLDFTVQSNTIYKNKDAKNFIRIVRSPIQYLGKIRDVETVFNFISSQFSFDGVFFGSAKKPGYIQQTLGTFAIFSDTDWLKPPMEKIFIDDSGNQKEFLLLRSKAALKKTRFEKNKLIVESVEKNPITVNGVDLKPTEIGDQNIVTRLPIDGKVRIVTIDAKSYSISRTFNPVEFTSDQEKEVEIAHLVGNSIQNPSFEAGSWQIKVSDCNKYDSNAVIGMTLSTTEKTDGAQALQLEAARHTACVSKEIDIPQIDEYMLGFDYQSPNGQNAGYYLEFDDESRSVIREMLPIVSNNWGSYVRKIRIPAGAKKAKLYLYGYSRDEKENIITRYDNIRFGKLKIEKVLKIASKEGYEKIPLSLKVGENTVEYKDPQFSYKNLFLNPSFEQGLWQSNVGDCARYDDNALIAMGTSTLEKTDGTQSLELSATRHAACTLTTVPVKGGSIYAFSFDYQSPNAKLASYYISFSDADKSSIKNDLPIMNTQWQTYSDTITVPRGASTLSFYVYAKETDKKTNIINRYDNFKLVEIPNLQETFYLVSEPTTTLAEPKAITFDLVSPTKRQVHIKGATTPFFLGMSESYHDQWQLQLRNAKIEGWLNGWWPFAKPDRVEDAFHYKLDGFLNAWYVDTNELCVKQAKCVQNADGSYDIEMTIEFWPQRWFYLGLLISGTTLAGCLGYLAFDGVRILRRKRKEKHTTV